MENGVAWPLNDHKWKRHAGPVGNKLQTVIGLSSKVGSPTRSMPSKNAQGGSDRGDDRFGVANPRKEWITQ